MAEKEGASSGKRGLAASGGNDVVLRRLHLVIEVMIRSNEAILFRGWRSFSPGTSVSSRFRRRRLRRLGLGDVFLRTRRLSSRSHWEGKG